MNVLVIGQGGREHALLWKLKQSGKAKNIYCAPGNGGTASIAENVPIRPDDLAALCDFCEEKKIDLTVVGPEAPLAIGIVDLFRKKGLNIFGPTKYAAQLESSKIFTKKLAREKNIPSASFEIFSDAKEAKDFVKSEGAPIVIKADGLASGKGVVVAKTLNEAFSAIDKMLVDKIFGAAGSKIIIEECLHGEEASIIVISDGENVIPLASSQDHKRIFDGDKGPNTGGMGAYSPAPVVTEEIFERTLSEIIRPAVYAMKEKGSPLKGVLYAGIMISDNRPKLLEFNVRFGDPETQAILPRMDSDLLELVMTTNEGSLKNYNIKWKDESCVSIVMASGGYPGEYTKGKVILGADEAARMKNILLFHAGTRLETKEGKKKLLTDGGRVLNVVSLGKGIKNAVDNAYKAAGVIKFEGAHYRKDIGYRALLEEKRNFKLGMLSY